MKRASSVIGIISLATLTLAPARAGFLAMMRGEPECPAPNRRVAFVGSARIKSVEGKAEQLCGIDCWRPISAGMHLKTGDVVRTGKGVVVLKMNESQSFVKVAPNTVLRLVTLEKEWDRAVLTGSEERSGFAVRSCRGPAFYQDKAGDWKPVLVNSVLPDSAILRTESGTVVDLYWTSARRSLRVDGEKNVKLANMAAPHSSGTALAAISR
jgi:hypothetical protein